MNKYIATAVLVFTLMLTGYSQSDILINQYNANMINPAYAGSDGNLNLGAMYSSEWIGLMGAPKSFIINAHSPITKGFGIGVSNYYESSLLLIRENNINVDISYKITFPNTSELSFGVKGMSRHTNLDFEHLANENDVNFDDLPVIGWTPNIGIGSFYHNNKFFIGISAYSLLNIHNQTESEIVQDVRNNTHFDICTGYVFHLSDNIKLKPSFLLKAVKDSSITYTLATNVFFDNILEFGMYYAEGSHIGFILNSPEILKILHIGIAPKYYLTNLSDYSSFGMTLFTNFNINTFSKGPKTKRYF